MVVAYALDVHRVSQSVEATALINRGKHGGDCLDIVHIREKYVEVVLESLPVLKRYAKSWLP